MGDKRWWPLLGWRVVALLGGLGGSVSLWSLASFEQRLSMMTPIVVLDRSSALRSIPPDAPREIRERMMGDLMATARKLSASGYLVLDSGWVIAAPEDLYVRPAP